MKKDKVVLAYSGGLDTSIILKWLVNKGFEVICFVGDVGQSDDFNLVKEKALNLGAKEVHIRDLQEEFIVDYIFPALWTKKYPHLNPEAPNKFLGNIGYKDKM